jgi:surface antigen
MSAAMIRKPRLVIALCTLALLAGPVHAAQQSQLQGATRAYLQCVPYARQVSGISIYGDAWTWWDQAEGRYARGGKPKVGAVMAFQPHGNMRLGHVAAVSRIVDKRTVLLRHANWSPINGTRGQIEDDVRAIDVSPDNDWSEVRVWYAPIQAIGGTAWPVRGFIYPDKPVKLAKAKLAEKVLGGEVEVKPAPATKAKSGRRDVIGEIIAGGGK